MATNSLIFGERDLILIGAQRHAIGETSKSSEFEASGTEFVLNTNIYCMEYMMLRAIMTSLNYKVSEIKRDENYWIIVHTSYPWEKMSDIECQDRSLTF